MGKYTGNENQVVETVTDNNGIEERFRGFIMGDHNPAIYRLIKYMQNKELANSEINDVMRKIYKRRGDVWMNNQLSWVEMMKPEPKTEPKTEPAPKTPVLKLVKKLKENNEDNEFYPTTDKIINIIRYNLRKNDKGDSYQSILDCGAGNGKVLESLTKGKMYAIEKSKILVEELSSEIFVVGCNFWENSLIDKKVDVVFSNPPYSEYKEWSIKIIREANASEIFLVIPERWKNQDDINQAIEDRGARVEVIGSDDFMDAERKARAKVDILRINLRPNRISYLSDAPPDIDPFSLWVGQTFPINDKKEDQHKKESNQEKLKRQINELVPGRGLVPVMVELYENELATLQKNFKAISELDQSIFKELKINFSSIKEFLKNRINGIKGKYWRELFGKFSTITSRLTKKSREKLLQTLTDNISVDFNESNIYAVTTWAIKNANNYFDSQLIDVFETLIKKANLVRYKSNQKTWGEDGWRFNDGLKSGEIKNFGLDYRCVISWGNTFGDTWYGATNGLKDHVHEKLNDIITIANNLGFFVPDCEQSDKKEWEPGLSVDFHTTNEKKLMNVRAYKNGNIHIKFNQKFLRKLNVEFGRLKGWLRSPEHAANELNIDVKEAMEFFKGNFALECSNTKLLAV